MSTPRIALLACLLLPGLAIAQAQQSADPYTLRSSTALVLVPTQVETGKGEILYGLRPDQFVLEDNGVPQTFRVEEDSDAQGLSLVVVVQCSRSAIRQFDNLRGLPAMVDDLLGGAPRQVAVVSYGQEPTLITQPDQHEFTENPDVLAANLAQLQPCDDGANATLDAVEYANRLFERSPMPGRARRAILLISETRDHGSHIKPAEVIANLGRSNTVVDSVSFNPGKTSMLDSLLHGQMGPGAIGLLVMAVEAVRANVPHTLASLSGGEYLNFGTQKTFDRRVHTLANHIHNFYLLSFQPATADKSAPAAGLHRLTVRVPDYPDARVRSRLSYYYGDAPPPDVPDKASRK